MIFGDLVGQPGIPRLYGDQELEQASPTLVASNILRFCDLAVTGKLGFRRDRDARALKQRR